MGGSWQSLRAKLSERILLEQRAQGIIRVRGGSAPKGLLHSWGREKAMGGEIWAGVVILGAWVLVLIGMKDKVEAR